MKEILLFVKDNADLITFITVLAPVIYKMYSRNKSTLSSEDIEEVKNADGSTIKKARRMYK